MEDLLKGDLLKVACIVGGLIALLAVSYRFFRHKDAPKDKFEEWDRKQW